MKDILSIPGAKDICIEMNSMSKSHNMPGWRIGMLATNAQFVEWILRVKSNIDSGMFRPLQTAAVTALGTDEEWHREMNVELYRKRRKIAEKIAKELDCTYESSQVGMFYGLVFPNKKKMLLH